MSDDLTGLIQRLREAAKFLHDCRGTEPAEHFEQHAMSCRCAADRLAAQRQQQARWQPIATAPKDGAKILLVWLDVERTALVCYVPHLGGWHEPAMGQCRPTHWMPLPDPPAAVIAEQDQ